MISLRSHRFVPGIFLAAMLCAFSGAFASDHADPQTLNAFQSQSDPAANITDLDAFLVDAKGRPLLTDAELKNADQLVIVMCVRRRLLPWQTKRLDPAERLSEYSFRVHLDLNPEVRFFDATKTRDGRDYGDTLKQLNSEIIAAEKERETAGKARGMQGGTAPSTDEVMAQAKARKLVAERAALVTQHAADESMQRLYGGIIPNAATIAEEALLDFKLNFVADEENSEATLAGHRIEGIAGEVNQVILGSKSADGKRDITRAQAWKPGAINIQTGIFDDPFIFPRFFRSNVVGIVTSIPLKNLRRPNGAPALGGPILLWATTHRPDGKQSDHVGRSLRTQLPRFGYLNGLHPSKHAAEIQRMHASPTLLENGLSTFLSPLAAHRHYDTAPDVMVYDLRKPAKFPNGRWLGDDVAKTLADAGETLLLELAYSESRQFPRAETNDKEFRATFPYLAPRWTTAQSAAHMNPGARFGDFDLGESADKPEDHDATIPGTKLTGSRVPDAPDSGAIGLPDFTPGVWKSLWCGVVLLVAVTGLLAFLMVRGPLKRAAVLFLALMGICMLSPIRAEAFNVMDVRRPKQPNSKLMLVLFGGGLSAALSLTALYAFGIRRGIVVAKREAIPPLGDQRPENADFQYEGSTFREVRDAVLAEPYYGTVWGESADKPLPVYTSSFASVAQGLFSLSRRFLFLDAAQRTIESHADLRWGNLDPHSPQFRKGVKRIIHPNGICLAGVWRITQDTPYTGFFAKGSEGLVIARYSSGLGVRRGQKRTLSMVGKLYPTTSPDERHRPASFITQEDLGATYTDGIHESLLLNAPNITLTKRFPDLGSVFLFAFTFFRADSRNTIRQLHEIAELGKVPGVKTNCPQFMQLRVMSEKQGGEDATADFRDEVLAQIYDRGTPGKKRDLVFEIAVSDKGKVGGFLNKTLKDTEWHPIGTITFNEASASYNGDLVIHFHHPKWRNDVNNPDSVSGPSKLARFVNYAAAKTAAVLGFFVKKS